MQKFLDVYKRQKVRRVNLFCIKMTHFMKRTDIRFGHIVITPVSYTHLDVYKRQVNALIISLIQIVLQFSAAAWMTQFTKRLRLNLTDTLSGNIEFFSNFFQRTGTSITVSYTHLVAFLGNVWQFRWLPARRFPPEIPLLNVLQFLLIRLPYKIRGGVLHQNGRGAVPSACLLYTSNRQLRKVTKSKTVFPSDDSLLKMLYLATMDITKKWTGRRRDWAQIRAQLEIYFEERLEKLEP